MLKTGNEGYRDHLLERFAERRAKNTHYSLRAFARDLGISPSALSQVLSGKRDLSQKNALKVADRLNLSPSQLQKMMAEIRGVPGGGSFRAEGYRLVQDDIFKLMSDWHYLAILNLAKLPFNEASPSWVASRLGISLPEAKTALRRLERLGLLEVRGNRLHRTSAPLTTARGAPSSAIRNYHKQNLKLAEASIERDPIHLRDMSSLTMAVAPGEIQAAKEAIERFKARFARLFRSEEPTEVYTMSIQLFPVTRRTGEKP